MDKEIKKLKITIKNLSEKDFIVQECLKLKKENKELKKENLKLTIELEDLKWKEFYKKMNF